MAKTKRTPRKRIVFHVVYNRESKWWDLIQVSGHPAGRRRLIAYSASKKYAITIGRRWATKVAETKGKKAQLKVHGKNGKFIFENTYGEDPKRFKG